MSVAPHSKALALHRCHDRDEACGLEPREPLQSSKDRFGNPLGHLHLSLCEADRRTLDGTRELILGIYRGLGAVGVTENAVTVPVTTSGPAAWATICVVDR